MSSNPEHDELIDNIKRPVRYYRISISGYGGELVYDTATKEQYEYWNSNQAKEDCGVESDENALSEYLWSFEDDPDRFGKVPKSVHREGNWHEQDSVAHLMGAAVDSASITIEELDADHLMADVIKEIVINVPIYDFVDEEDAEINITELEFESEYVFFGMSVEKGTFFDAVLETQGPINLSKLKFEVRECHNGDEIITDVYYNDELVESQENDTNGKDMIIEIVEV